MQALITMQALEENFLATLTIRNLDDTLKNRLRVRAASRNRSMEEEARQILRAALEEASPSPSDLATRIRSRFTAFGDVRLPMEARDPVRQPPVLEEPAPVGTRLAPNRATSRKRRA